MEFEIKFKDKSNGRVEEMITFANTTGQQESLKNAFDSLNRHVDNGREVKVFHDFAPYSLYFEMYNEDRLWMNGGVIYHGPHDGFGNGGAPTFSVSLTGSQGWSIHT